ncbi:dephospho-CoA kinase [Pulveribacter suum]|nr:dephospho-CoA kinase [Pulveribacter suum]
MLHRCGAALVDADQLARATTESGGSAIDAIREQFGEGFINASGAMDRDRMRALAFSEPQARERLQAIIHPLVGLAIVQAQQQAEAAGHRVVALDIPLLTESPRWPRQLDAVLVVDCREETQIERVRLRSGLDEAAVRAIMATQSSRATRRAAADWVVFNEGLGLPELLAVARQISASLGL